MSRQADVPRLPMIGEYVRGLGKLLRVEAAVRSDPPPPPDTVYVWESITARWEVHFQGDRLNVGAELWDYLGSDSAVARAKDEAQHYAREHQIGPRHALEVRVIRITHIETRRLATDTTERHAYSREFRAFGASDRSIEPREEVVWSSRGTKSPDDQTDGKGGHDG